MDLGIPTGDTATLLELDAENGLNELYDHVGSRYWDIPMPVYQLMPEDIATLSSRAGVPLKKAFKTAHSSQKKMVSQYRKVWLGQEIIVLDGNTILDGHHRAMAAILSDQPILAVDIYDAEQAYKARRAEISVKANELLQKTLASDFERRSRT